MIVSIEQHVDWIADCIDPSARRQAWRASRPRRRAQEAWVAHVNEVADTTLFPRANSWYMGANIPGKPRVFMPYIGGVGLSREVRRGRRQRLRGLRPAGRRASDGAPGAFPVGLAQLALEDLAEILPRQGVAEGRSCGASCSRRASGGARRAPRPRRASPGRGWMTAQTCSPNSSSGMPNTAQSATPGQLQDLRLDLGGIDVHAAGDDHVRWPGRTGRRSRPRRGTRRPPGSSAPAFGPGRAWRRRRGR